MFGLTPLQTFISHSAFATVAIQLVFVINLVWTWWRGKPAPANPWEATTLEWIEGHPEEVHRGPYEFSQPGRGRDYALQTEK